MLFLPSLRNYLGISHGNHDAGSGETCDRHKLFPCHFPPRRMRLVVFPSHTIPNFLCRFATTTVMHKIPADAGLGPNATSMRRPPNASSIRFITCSSRVHSTCPGFPLFERIDCTDPLVSFDSIYRKGFRFHVTTGYVS